jgi:hypothetical protein
LDTVSLSNRPAACVAIVVVLRSGLVCAWLQAMGSFGNARSSNARSVDDEAYLLLSCPAIVVVLRERRLAQLPFTSLQDLMCCRDVYGVALFVHKCMKIADAAAVAAAMQ